MIHEKRNNDIFTIKMDETVIYDLNPLIQKEILAMICVVDHLPYVGSTPGFFEILQKLILVNNDTRILISINNDQK